MKVACQERWSNYFAEEAVTLHFSAEPPLTGVAAWRLATGDRTLARGERAIDTHGEGASQFTVQFALPPVKDGVMMPAEVTVSVQPTGDQSAYSTNQSLWIFSRHAFVDSVTWLESVDIHLFDPEDNTAKMLEASEIPFSPVHNPDALATVTNGIIIVGEGASFQEWRALSRLMIDAARRGHHVLCLAPAEGDWVLPLAFDAEQSKPRRCTLAGNEIIKRMDKRFDHTAWAGDGRMLSSTFELQGRRDIIAAIHANEEGDWSWIELDYGPKGGRVIVLGFAIMAKWNVSPTPRYLFRSILEHLTPNRNENPHLTTKGVPQ
ncbi:MAG: hypothetical protein HQ523_16315 [Lentisphaerae bacterium]|nr:hypothetical protein [Lentisphaerota bacterium]